MMRFAEVAGGDIRLTEVGNVFANSESDERKRIFSRQLLNYVPLAAHIRRVLDERPTHVARKSRFSDELEDYMSEDDAEAHLAGHDQLGPVRRGVCLRRRERRLQPRKSELASPPLRGSHSVVQCTRDDHWQHIS